VIRRLRIENDQLTEMKESLESRIHILEPTMQDSKEITSALEERISVLRLEKTTLQTELNEERLAKDLLERELIDAQGLWEAEVKAKGILAEKITQYEKEIRQMQLKIVSFFHKIKNPIEQALNYSFCYFVCREKTKEIFTL